MTTGKTIALTRWTFVGKVMSLLFNMLSRLIITFFQGANIFYNPDRIITTAIIAQTVLIICQVL